MSFDCVKERLDGKKFQFLRKGTLKRLEADYQKILDAHMSRGATADAAQKAATEFYNREEGFIKKKNANAKKQIAANLHVYDLINKRFSAKRNLWDKALSSNKMKHIIAWMGNKPTMSREMNEYLLSTESLANAHEIRIRDMMVDALAFYDPNVFGVLSRESKEKLDMIFKSAGGQSSGIQKIDKAGAQVRQALDELTDRYIAAGGVMGKLENWMPQIHDSMAIQRAGADAWKRDIIPRIDWDRVVDEHGFALFSNAQISKGIYSPDFTKFLDDVYETLSTDGANKISEAAKEGKGIKGQGSLASRYSKHRVLHFKAPEDQLAYNKLYGSDDPFMSILNHVQSMSREIALMENLGPRPQSFIDNMNNRLLNTEEKGLSKFTQKMYDVLIGRTAMTGSESGLYRTIKGIQSYLRGTQLGSAFIPALGDSLWSAQALRMSGIEQKSNMISGIGKYMVGLAKNDKKLANFRVYLLESSSGNTLHRFMEGDTPVTQGKGVIDKFSAATQNYSTLIMRTSGLSALTQHGKDFVSLEAFGTMALRKDTSWTGLPEDFRDFMERSGNLTEADWRAIQKAETIATDDGRASFLFPSEVAKIDKGAAVRYEAVIQRLRALATNEPDIRTKAVTTQGLESGSAMRALADMVFMYRSFPITMMNNYLRPMLTKAVIEGDTRLGSTLFATTLMGYMILNLKDAINGVENKEGLGGLSYLRPFDMTTAKQSMLQGGGLGIFGDFFAHDYSRYGESLEKTATGPMFGFMNDLMRMGFDGTEADWQGFVRKYLPAKSLWWSKGVLDYAIIDALDKVDPKHYEREESRRRYLSEQGQRDR